MELFVSRRKIIDKEQQEIYLLWEHVIQAPEYQPENKELIGVSFNLQTLLDIVQKEVYKGSPYGNYQPNLVKNWEDGRQGKKEFIIPNPRLGGENVYTYEKAKIQ